MQWKNHTKTMWTYHREMVLESILSRQRESAFTITAGVKKIIKNTSLFIYRGQIRLSIKNKILIFLIHSRLMQPIIIYNRRDWKLETAYIIQS